VASVCKIINFKFKTNLLKPRYKVTNFNNSIPNSPSSLAKFLPSSNYKINCYCFITDGFADRTHPCSITPAPYIQASSRLILRRIGFIVLVLAQNGAVSFLNSISTVIDKLAPGAIPNTQSNSSAAKASLM
jgi:hypothetical protein